MTQDMEEAPIPMPVEVNTLVDLRMAEDMEEAPIPLPMEINT